MTYAEWFETCYRRKDDGEKKTAAIMRLSLETGVSHVAIRRALEGTQVRPETAARLVAPAGGAVSAEALAMAPTRARHSSSTDTNKVA